MNKDEFEKTLKRQLRQSGLDKIGWTAELESFISSIDNSYKLYKKEIQMLNRAMELSSKELQSKNIELKKAADLSKEFSHIAAHNLKEPIRTINGFSALLAKKSKVLGDQEREYLRLITNAGSTMYNYLSDLTNFLLLEDFKSEQKIVQDLNAVIRRCTASLTHQIDQNNAEVIVQNLPSIKSFPSTIDQLFQNLISNSIKFRSDEKPLIHISSEINQQHLNILVSDNGKGIEPKYKDQVFDVYCRLDKSIEGTGMGLSICKRIVEMHEGKISLYPNKQKKGTTFCIQFPAVYVM